MQPSARIGKSDLLVLEAVELLVLFVDGRFEVKIAGQLSIPVDLHRSIGQLEYEDIRVRPSFAVDAHDADC